MPFNQEMGSQTPFSIKHTFHLKSKPRTDSGIEYYPLYIEIEAFGKQAMIKSQIHDYLTSYISDLRLSLGNNLEITKLVLQGLFSESLFKQVRQLKSFPLYNLLNDEILLVKNILSELKNRENERFSLEKFSEIYALYSSDITKVLDESIKRDYSRELRNVFEQNLHSSNNPKACKVSNFLLHFIRWDNDFLGIYDNCYEMMPGEVRFVEKYFSKETLHSIRAYMAFQPKINVFKNIFGRQEQGEITRLTYLDWLQLKELLFVDFEAFFGSRTAKEYIDILHGMLEKQLKP